MRMLKRSSLSLLTALTMGIAGGQALAATTTQPMHETTIERKTEVLPDPSLGNTTVERKTEIYRSETDVVDNDDRADANDAEIAGVSVTTLMIFALLAFAVVAIVVALSRRETTVV
ncbi:MAG TPA: hypothetical protein V6D23_18255 [Candidatus Obscuribacterales bacterium]